MGEGIHTGAFGLVKTDEFGNMECNQTHEGGGVYVAHSLVVASDGGYTIAGVTRSFGVGGSDDFCICLIY